MADSPETYWDDMANLLGACSEDHPQFANLLAVSLSLYAALAGERRTYLFRSASCGVPSRATYRAWLMDSAQWPS